MEETFLAQINKYKNRITIPKKVVDLLDLQPGDYIDVTITKKEKK